MAILNLSLPVNSAWVKLTVGTQSLIIGIVIIFCRNVYTTIKFYAALLISFIGDTKQRTRHHLLTLCFVICLLPLSCVFILLSSLFSCSVFPIFTLPLLSMVSPRPMFYWPQLIHKSFTSKAKETVFYKQAQKSIVKAISVTLSTGSTVPQPGDFMLLRFQDRTVMVHLLEKGYGYWTLSLQGLELQETSCHTVEATKMDDIINSGYTNSYRSLSYWFNVYPLTTFKLVDINTGRIYSDAWNNLSGIIDQHRHLSKFSSNLYKIITWMILNYSNRLSDVVMETPTESRNTELSNGDDNIVSLSASLSSLDLATLQKRVLATSANYQSHDSSQLKAPNSFTNNKVAPSHNRSTLSSIFPISDEHLSIALQQFPHEWFDFILCQYFNGHSFTVEKLNSLKSLIAVCFSIVDIPASCKLYNTPATSTRPFHLYNGFNGNFTVPLYTHFQWLKENSVLFDIVLKSYRYNQ